MNLDQRARRAAAQLHEAVDRRPLTAATPRPWTPVRRVALAAGAVLGVTLAALLVARGLDDRGQSVATVDQPGATTSPTTAPAGAGEGWARCTDEQRGFSVEYPAGWHTVPERLPAGVPDVGPCRFFHPTPFEIVANSEWPVTALEVSVADGTYAEHVRTIRDDLGQRVVRKEMTTVDGRRAVRVELEFTGEGFYDAGARYFGYVIEHYGSPLTVGGYWFPPSADPFSEREAVVEQAVKSLRFLPERHASGDVLIVHTT